MPAIGRPRLTPDELRERIAAYCRTYRVAATPNGMPPFPSGRRETDQHREWMKLYKAQSRMARRAHEDTALGDASAAERPSLHAAQDGRCPICLDDIDLHAPVDATRDIRALLHPHCKDAARLAASLGPEGLERLRAYLWPPKASRARGGGR